MPDLDVSVGGRTFTVACRDGEEAYLQAAAALLNAEATPIVEQMGRIPEARMLLMAGLIIADRLAGAEDQVRALQAELAAINARPAPAPQRIEVPVIPASVTDTLAEIAARAEALAAEVEDRVVVNRT